MDQRGDIGRPRHTSEPLIENICGDPPGHMQRSVEDPALWRIDQPCRRFSSVTCSATAWAAMMNISSVTRVASVANTAMPIAGKM